MSEHRDAPKATVLRPSQLPAHDRGGGARTTPLVTAALGATAFINGITTFEPGAAIAFHSHNCEESVLVLDGEAVLDIDGEETHLGPLDATWIPPQVSHRFRNASATKPMRIFWTYARVDATRTLTATGATMLVAAEHRS
jgi:quercetin dioxygenase-like cupin family protein